MTRTCIICIACWLLAIVATAQDFASRFLNEYQEDSLLVCTSISPKMMEKIMEADIKDEDQKEIKKVISKLHSMMMLETATHGKEYFDKAEEMLEKNANRFSPHLSYDEEEDNFRIMKRERFGKIVELVMLRHQKDSFIVINFTGNMNRTFIDRLTESMTHNK